MTNVQFSNSTHVFYNPETNIMVSIQYRAEFGLFEVLRSDLTARQLMSLNRIVEDRGTEVWEFLGVL